MELRQRAREFFAAAVQSVLPENLLPGYLKKLPPGRVHLLSVGKAGAGCARVAMREIGDRVASGLVISPEECDIEGLECIKASHPLPDQGSMTGGRKALSLARRLEEKDVLLVLLSGGASSLMVLPPPGVELGALQELYDLMLKKGLTIHEINTVRRHLSLIKGGRLAVAAGPARVITLMISDVVGDTMEDIGSGPTAPDPTLRADAISVLKRTRIWHSVNNAIREALWSLPETPKPKDPAFRRVSNTVVGNNLLALKAIKQRAEEMGLGGVVITDTLEGEAREIGRAMAGVLRAMVRGRSDIAGPGCLIFGGETTVKVKGQGKGGRNQELALSCAMGIKGLPDAGIVAFSTDGRDGPVPAAGAFADGETCLLAEQRGISPLKYLDNNDAFTFFGKVGGLLETGPTGTNVADCIVLISDGLPRNAGRAL